MGDSLEALCGFNPRRPLVLDGGFGQLIADKYPHLDMSDGLWASGVAVRCPDVIRYVHLMYLRAGADIISTATYQASANGYISAGLANDKAGAKRLMESTLLLAVEARDQYMREHGCATRLGQPMISASLGSIGATLGNCSEYTGDYGCAVTPARMREFHEERLGMLADCLHGSVGLRDQIDLLAIETIPSAAEASAVADALEALHGRGTRLPPAWISFTSSTADRIGCGDTIEDAVKAIANCPRVCAIGINCVPLGVVGELLAGIRRATQKPIVCYPNGQPWSDANGGWHADDGLISAAHFACEAAEWVRCGASIVGGCCRTTAENTRALVERMLELRHE